MGSGKKAELECKKLTNWTIPEKPIIAVFSDFFYNLIEDDYIFIALDSLNDVDEWSPDLQPIMHTDMV